MNRAETGVFDTRMARTWAEIDLGQVKRNAEAVQKMAGQNGAAVAVVKADGYGHGAIAAARAAASGGVGHFAVACASEALALRRAGITGEIYTMSPFLPEEADALVRADVTPFVSSVEQCSAYGTAAGNAPFPARCFLHVDTGMGRCGMLPEEAQNLWNNLPKDGPLQIAGVSTHFSSADELDEDSDRATAGQIARFADFLAAVRPDFAAANHGQGVWLSLCNSPAALRFREQTNQTGNGIRGALLRAGLLLYGIEPYPGAAAIWGDVAPVLTWRARITLLRSLPEGFPIGYGRTHTLSRPSLVGTIAAGYADGLPRLLSNQGHVLYQGRRFPIIGRVSMDQCQIDLTDAHTPPSVGDSVTIIGTDGSETQTAADLAAQTKTTPHEPTCALTARVPRLYVSS